MTAEGKRSPIARTPRLCSKKWDATLFQLHYTARRVFPGDITATGDGAVLLVSLLLQSLRNDRRVPIFLSEALILGEQRDEASDSESDRFTRLIFARVAVKASCSGLTSRRARGLRCSGGVR